MGGLVSLSQKLILESGVPAFFTDYCEEAGFVAEQCMRKLHGTALSFPVSFPFSFLPHFGFGFGCACIYGSVNCV